MKPDIKIEQYTYSLPEEKIAKYPLPDRDASKILIFENNLISEAKFLILPQLLASDSLIVFNNTKVVPARLLFRKPTGATIEIFCLEPYKPADYISSFSSIGECYWTAVVGNAKRWRSGTLYFGFDGDESLIKLNLRATLERKLDSSFLIKFQWDEEVTFSEVLEICGKVPIPPYLQRETQDIDKERYQTLYAKERGSVAAPTAGLHFTEKVINGIRMRGVEISEISLHIGAGTFVPVKSEAIIDHKMHSEAFSVSLDFIKKILNKYLDKKSIVAVGTTSARCIESLYYLGVQCIEDGEPKSVSQWEPYLLKSEVSVIQTLEALIKWMVDNGQNSLNRKTEIIIVPGYGFKLVNTLITNFHQPQSTLLLLIAAFIGQSWREVYNYALQNNFRFLSYGDSSILFR